MRLKKPDQKFLLFCAISMLTGILAGIFLAVKCRTGNGAAGRNGSVWGVRAWKEKQSFFIINLANRYLLSLYGA